MKFSWNPEKERLNRRKHRVSFEEACYIFADPFMLTIFDEDHSEDEDRWVSMGRVAESNVLVVVHTHHVKNSDEYVRIISARRATARERKTYQMRLEGRK